jgi:hypothetical protein
MVVFFTHDIYGDQIAKTNDGKTVLLKSNGTWEYVTIDPKTRKITRLESSKPGNTPQNPGTSISNKNISKKPVKFSNKEMASIADELNVKKGSDFRNVNWGVTIQQVKKIENLKLINEKDNLLEYEYTLIGMRCKVIYYFRNNSLTKAQYKIDRKHYDPANFNRDYLALKKYLVGLYGDPKIDKDTWHNDQYKSDKTKWGFAVSIGFLTRMAIWKKNNQSKIIIEMLGENHKAYINIKFTALTLSR